MDFIARVHRKQWKKRCSMAQPYTTIHPNFLVVLFAFFVCFSLEVWNLGRRTSINWSVLSFQIAIITYMNVNNPRLFLHQSDSLYINNMLYADSPFPGRLLVVFLASINTIWIVPCLSKGGTEKHKLEIFEYFWMKFGLTGEFFISHKHLPLVVTAVVVLVVVLVAIPLWLSF